MKKRRLVLNGMALFSLSGLLLAGCSDDDTPESPKPPVEVTPYVTKVFEYVPAPGQFVNEMPIYNDGDTQETMNAKVLEAIGNNAKGLITLGGYGGFVTIGFDHTVENKSGLCDFRVLGNAFSGNSEPGIIMVSADANGNGKPDDEWYEIAGSSYYNAKGESWYKELEGDGNDMNVYHDYSITYRKPASEPAPEQWKQYIKWTDNKGKEGYVEKNHYHNQSYFPAWLTESELKFEGLTRLPQNSKKTENPGSTSDEDRYIYKMMQFGYGYADNVDNGNDLSAIDIDWAVDKNGEKVQLKGIDFVKIYTGVNQTNGWIGECSTEIVGVEDLHLLNEKIETFNK